jgi:hypothetical protein
VFFQLSISACLSYWVSHSFLSFAFSSPITWDLHWITLGKSCAQHSNFGRLQQANVLQEKVLTFKLFPNEYVGALESLQILR